MKLFNKLSVNVSKNIKMEYTAPDGESLFVSKSDESVLDPIMGYMLDDTNGDYVPPE